MSQVGAMGMRAGMEVVVENLPGAQVVVPAGKQEEAGDATDGDRAAGPREHPERAGNATRGASPASKRRAAMPHLCQLYRRRGPVRKEHPKWVCAAPWALP